MSDKHPLHTAYDTPSALAALRGADIAQVKIGIFDVDTVLREKTVSPEKAAGFLERGARFSNVIYEWDSAEQTYEGGAFADEEIRLDPGSGRVHPFLDRTALFIADFTGAHADFSPRQLLARQITRLAGMGYVPRAGFEYEFSVFEETPESLRSKNYGDLRHYAVGNRTYSAITPVVEEHFITPLLAAMTSADIGIDAFHTELGPGCFEVPLKAETGLRAADNAALFKTFARIHALRQGKMATFMAKWATEWPGQGGHVHISLSDPKTGAPLFADPQAQPNPVMRHFIAGLVTYLPEALALCAHTTNAYRRLVPGAWAPSYSSWGIENRSCAVRAIPGPGTESRIEFRVPGADANPYLTLACALGCGIRGMEAGLEPPEPVVGDAYGSTAPDGMGFPHSLHEAAERFRASTAMRDIFGAGFVDWFARTRIWEHHAVAREVTDIDRRRYFEAV